MTAAETDFETMARKAVDDAWYALQYGRTHAKAHFVLTFVATLEAAHTALSARLAEAEDALRALKSRLPLGEGLFALIDPEDYERLCQHKWRVLSQKTSRYVINTAYGRKQTRLHHAVLGYENRPFPMIDHKNGDGLDNRKENLRLATFAGNARNRKLNVRSSTGFKGVYHREGGRYLAKIRADGKKYHLGSFATPEQAARAYDLAAIRLHGEFARINFDRAIYADAAMYDPLAVREEE